VYKAHYYNGSSLFFFFRVLFIHLRKREYEQGGEGVARSPLNREPDAGLDPGTLGS